VRPTRALQHRPTHRWPDTELTELLVTLANCEKARSVSIYDRCKAVYEGLRSDAEGHQPERGEAARRSMLAASPRYGHRASKWANPFMIRHDGERDEVIAMYDLF
jgi:hypothetical protein